jgi:hypothetical protein
MTCLRIRSAAPSVLLALLVVCGAAYPQAGSRQHRFEVRQEDGVPTAVSRGAPKYESELFRYEHVLTLKQDPAVLESLIAGAKGFVMTEEGQFVVVDNKLTRGGPVSARLVLFDDQGACVRSIGGLGQGPGEFQSMQLVAVVGDIIEVHDAQLHRLTRYRTSGERVDVTSLPATAPLVLGLFRTLENGNRVALNLNNVNIKEVSAGFLLLDPGGTVLVRSETPVLTSAIDLDMGGGRPMPYQYPYPPIPTARFLSDGGIAMSPGNDPVIDIFGADGALRKRIRVENLLLRLEAEDISRFEQVWEERIRNAPEPARPEARRQRDALRNAMPEERPPWSYVGLDDAGYWWLRIQEEVDPWTSGDQAYSYRLLSPEGEYLGTTRAPPTHLEDLILRNLFPVSVTKGCFLTMETDSETGETLLNVYRLVPAAAGFRYP